MAAGLKVIHVAYKGGPDAMIEVLGGRAHYHLGTLGVTIPYIKEGKLIALAVTTQRTPVLPDVPSLGEIYAEFQRPDTSHGLLAPAGTPRAIVDQISKETLRIVASPEMKERMQAIGFVGAPAGAEEYSKILRGQIESMSRLVRDAGLKGKAEPGDSTGRISSSGTKQASAATSLGMSIKIGPGRPLLARWNASFRIPGRLSTFSTW